MKKSLLPAVIISLLIFAAMFFGHSVKSFAKNNSDNDKSNIAYPYFLKRNPFQTFLYTQKHNFSFKVGQLPLLKYDISSLKVVGIMERRGKYFALIQTPDKRSYIITAGSLVGINRATVLWINDREVYLTERTYDVLGRVQSSNVVMLLK